MLAEIIGPDILIILVIVVLLFGGSQIPKLARSLGQASKEFKGGLADRMKDDAPAATPRGTPTGTPPGTPTAKPSDTPAGPMGRPENN